MRALATWCFRHRRTVLVSWILLLVVVSAAARSVGTDFSNDFQLPDTPSTKALKLLQENSPKLSGDQEQVVFETSSGRHITDPDVESAINDVLSRLLRLPHATSVASPIGAFAAQRISPSGTIAFATLIFDKGPQSINQDVAKQMVDIAQSADRASLRVAVSGQLAAEAKPPSVGGSGLGILLAAVVLLLFFGSAFAMALPLLSALLALGTAIGFITMLSHVLAMPQFAPELVILVGLGVGVDYALFITTRHRQGLVAGRDVESAAVAAVNTSGRAVLFAGIVVCIALLGMFALGVSFLYGLAVAASIGVLLTMVSALTLLPAMLGFIGPRIMSRKQKKELATKGPRIVGAGSSGFWPRWASFIQDRPALPAVAALVVIGALVLPFFSLRLGATDQGNDPVGSTTRTAYDTLAKGFGPGFNGPLMVVAQSPSSAPGGSASAGADPIKAVLDRLTTDFKAQSDVAAVGPAIVLPAKTGGEVALLEVYPKGSPQDVSTTTLISHLRSRVIPPVVVGSSVTVYVGGGTAIFADFARVLSHKLPLFVGLVVLLSFLLLSVVFRSVAVPLTGAAMNLLSIGGAFGLLVAVFGWGWVGGIFGVNRAGPVEAFLPVMLFSILFGLSMDYQVFLVTRIHEEYLKSGTDNRLAVRNGLAATGKTITAAAVIMILVFGSFILGGERVIKEFGVGLGGGILIDAVIIRMTIVPSLMQLIGKANWWFPRSLDRWLPHLSVDPDTGPDAPAGNEAEEQLVAAPVS